ncbi:MAG: phage holin family protein [Burkholderiaceae bacterium]|nr:MAG: phage holin family protein [Burkholderiaceae bacterium]
MIDGVLGLAQVRLELASVELREEVARLGELALYAAIALVLLSLGLGFLAVLLTVLFWDSHRIAALAVFATLFLTLGAVAVLAARARLPRQPLLADTLDELQRDRDALRAAAAANQTDAR